MKRFFILLISLSTAALAFGVQPRPFDGPSPVEVALRVYQTPEWARAFAGSYGVNPGVEPGLPDNDQEREALGKIRDLVQAGSDNDMREALRVIEDVIRARERGESRPSAMIYQIAGTLALRMVEITSGDDSRQQYQERAERYLRRAIDPNTGFPNFLRVHKNLANLYFRTERPEQALEHFRRAVELGDKEGVTFGLMGAIYLERGRYISAESALRQALMVAPNIREFRQLLGQVLLNQERYQEAVAIFSELLMEQPDNTTFWILQSNSFVALDMIDEAAVNLEIIRSMGAANSPALMLLGDIYMNREMVIEAAQVYREAIALDPSSTQLTYYIRSAETLNNYAAYEEALSVIETIEAHYEELTEDHEVELLTIRSEINIAMGQGAEAAENLEQLLRRDPLNARALLTLAGYYSDFRPSEDLSEDEARAETRRMQQKAILYYERAQNLDDDRTRVNAYIGEAQLRVQRDELQKAASLLEEAQRIRPQDHIQSYLDQIRSALRSRRRG
ncbi:MAG: tetratricopeptide repeat protein [Opitutales bacterium]|nr:tetratricopeptide repeat protein [Opitutales bacterium]